MKLAFGSCVEVGRNVIAAELARDIGCTHFLLQGDTPYCNVTATYWGISLTAHAVGDTVADVFKHHQCLNLTPGMQSMIRNFTVYYMPDDHEWGGDDWDHTLTQSESQTPIGAVSQAEVDAAFWVGNQAVIQAIDQYYANPQNDDAEAIAEKPSSADAGTSAGQYPVRYFRQRLTDTGAPAAASVAAVCELFVIDCISYRSPLAATDDASKTMIGANQKAWLKSYLLASDAPFKIIASGKTTYYGGAGDNEDGWNEYSTERDELLSYIDANGITGVIWIAGDKHYSKIIASSKAAGDEFDHLCVCACPLTIDNNAAPTIGEGYTVQTIAGQVFGVLTITAEVLQIAIRSAYTGAVKWSGQLLVGQNALSYPASMLSV